jgi:hypothetical protein
MKLASDIEIDGQITDWPETGWQMIDSPLQVAEHKAYWRGPEDCGAKIQLGISEKYIAGAIVISDNNPGFTPREKIDVQPWWRVPASGDGLRVCLRDKAKDYVITYFPGLYGTEKHIRVTQNDKEMKNLAHIPVSVSYDPEKGETVIEFKIKHLLLSLATNGLWGDIIIYDADDLSGITKGMTFSGNSTEIYKKPGNWPEIEIK